MRTGSMRFGKPPPSPKAPPVPRPGKIGMPKAAARSIAGDFGLQKGKGKGKRR